MNSRLGLRLEYAVAAINETAVRLLEKLTERRILLSVCENAG